jgi:hypothetical protein
MAVEMSPTPTTPPVQVAASAAGNTPAQAAQALSDVVNASGGLVGSLSADLSANPNALLRGAAAVLVVLAAWFTAILACALAGNRLAQGYVGSIFTATSVWIVVAGVLVGGAYLAQSPLKGQQ